VASDPAHNSPALLVFSVTAARSGFRAQLDQGGMKKSGRSKPRSSITPLP
jgi:hypothetical protein